MQEEFLYVRYPVGKEFSIHCMNSSTLIFPFGMCAHAAKMTKHCISSLEKGVALDFFVRELLIMYLLCT